MKYKFLAAVFLLIIIFGSLGVRANAQIQENIEQPPDQQTTTEIIEDVDPSLIYQSEPAEDIPINTTGRQAEDGSNLLLVNAVISLLWTVSGIFWYCFIFKKAGHPAWAPLIPVYGSIILMRIIGRRDWDWLWLLVPFYSVYFYFKIFIELAHHFSRSTAFGVAMVFLEPFMLPVLLSKDSKYHKRSAA